jgi:hypothetical protein
LTFADDRFMTSTHSARRGIATAAGGLVVVSAGAASGLIIADMHATWADQAALETASAAGARPADVAQGRPVVVTLTEEQHVTPEPVIVHKRVYRTRIVGDGASPAPQQTAPRRTTSNGSTRPAAAPPKLQQPRAVVAPAPRAPAPSSGRASSGTTSKTS